MIRSMHGRHGGMYFKTDGSIIHAQKMPRVARYSRMGFQGFMIGGFSAAAAFWMLALLGAWAAIWAIYAASNLFRKPGRRPSRITGYMWFIHYALMFPEAESLPFWKPPHSPGDLPWYVVTYRGAWMYDHTEDFWPIECCAGYYWKGMVWGGKRSYRTDNYDWHIWWGGTFWLISPSPGFTPVNRTFHGTGPDISGYYQHVTSKRWAHCYFSRRFD